MLLLLCKNLTTRQEVCADEYFTRFYVFLRNQGSLFVRCAMLRCYKFFLYLKAQVTLYEIRAALFATTNLNFKYS